MAFLWFGFNVFHLNSYFFADSPSQFDSWLYLHLSLLVFAVVVIESRIVLFAIIIILRVTNYLGFAFVC